MKPLFYLLLLFLSILFADDLVALVAARHDAKVETTDSRRDASPMIVKVSLSRSPEWQRCDVAKEPVCIRHASPFTPDSHLFSDVQRSSDGDLCDGGHDLVAQ